MKIYRLIYEGEKFCSMPEKKQLLEDLIIILAQYFQPNLYHWRVKAWLNDIAQVILNRLKDRHSRHPILSINEKQLHSWRDNNIYANQWSEKESRQIMGVLREYIFNELDFTPEELHRLWITELEEDYLNFVSHCKIVLNFKIIFYYEP